MTSSSETEVKIDRLSKGYEPRFDIDLSVGRRGENHVLGLLDAIKEGTIEVKTDVRAADTGNLYIEYECLGKPSGIQTTEADAWAFVIGQETQVIIVPTTSLRYVYEQLVEMSKYRIEMNRGSRPTKGVLIPLKRLPEIMVLAKKAVEEKK